MLKVFIAHDPKDASDAQDLACRLSEGGVQIHLVQTAQEVWQLGEEAAEIIIVWSSNSLNSPRLYEIAAVFRDACQLHVKIGDLKPSHVAEPIRPRGLISITSHRLLLRRLEAQRKRRERSDDRLYALNEFAAMSLPKHLQDERLSDDLVMLESDTDFKRAAEALDVDEGVLAEAVEKAESECRARRKALGIVDGKLAHKIPETMTVNVEETLEVRLGHAEMQGLMLGLQGSGKAVEEGLPIVETMTVKLSGGHGIFAVIPLSRPIQLVNSERIKGCGYDEFGKWIWRVIPKKRGTHTLDLMVSANLLDERGVPASASLPPRTFPIRVKVNIGQVSRNLATVGASGAAGTFCAGMVGAYTQDIWWPTVKHWMQSIGLLS